MLSSKAESKLIANSGRTPPPLSPGSAVARILLPTATSGWVGEGVLPTAKIVPGSRKLFQGSDHLLVIEIAENYDGWLPERAWKWLHKQDFSPAPQVLGV